MTACEKEMNSKQDNSTDGSGFLAAEFVKKLVFTNSAHPPSPGMVWRA